MFWKSAIEVQQIREGVKLNPRKTGIQVVLEVGSTEHALSVVQTAKASGFVITEIA